MNVVEASRPGATRPPSPVRSEWLVLSVTGAAAFWSANLIVSLTPAAAAYRSAFSIGYGPMLVEAAVGGLIVAGVVALLLMRLPARLPGGGPVRRALLLAVWVLAVVTLLLEVPAKFGADVHDPVRWLFVAAIFNTIRVLALGLVIGLVARAYETRADRHRMGATEEMNP